MHIEFELSASLLATLTIEDISSETIIILVIKPSQVVVGDKTLLQSPSQVVDQLDLNKYIDGDHLFTSTFHVQSLYY